MADLSDIQAAGSTKIIGSSVSGSETTPVDSTALGELKTADILNSGTGTQGALTVGTSAVIVRVGGSNLANRKLLTLHNNSLVTLYWGYTSGVTTANGTPLFSGQMSGWAVGPSQNVYIIAGTAGNNTRVTEA